MFPDTPKRAIDSPIAKNCCWTSSGRRNSTGTRSYALTDGTSPTAACKIGEKTDDPLQMYLMDIFTISANLSGICGISLPCGFTQSPKLPIGLQLLGKPFGEETILRVAHAYEQSTHWHEEKPQLAGS